MAFEIIKMQSAVDQFPLTSYCWSPPEENIKAKVIISHGLGEHALRYAEFADALNSQGYAVFALDHRGHGASPGPQGLGDFGTGGWNALVEDVAQLTRVAQNRFAPTSVALFGHSMGSFAAQQYLFSHSNLINAVILSGSAAVDKLFAAMMQARANADPNQSALSAYNEGFPQRTGFEWLSRDEEQVDKYVADPLCGFDLLPDSMMSLASCAMPLADTNNINKIPKSLPMLLLAGALDPVTGRLELLKELQSRYQAAGIQSIDTLFYPDGRHEMLNEINRHEVYADIIQWLDKHLTSQ